MNKVYLLYKMGYQAKRLCGVVKTEAEASAWVNKKCQALMPRWYETENVGVVWE